MPGKQLKIVLTVLCLVHTLSLPAVAVDAGSPLPLYKGIVYFVDRDSLVCNCTYIEEATVKLSFTEVNQSFVKVVVSIRGMLHWMNATIHMGSETPMLISAKTVLLDPDYMFVVEYLVDKRVNYAWVDGEFIGFFPLYIFPRIAYDNATRYRYVYMGEELEIPTIEGKPVPSVLISNNYEVVTLVYQNRYINIEFVYHYPVQVYGFLPVSNETLLYIDLSVDESLVPYILSIDDYPRSVTTVDWGRLLLLVTVIAAGVAGSILYVRRRRG